MKFAPKLTLLLLGITVATTVAVSCFAYTSSLETLEKQIKESLEEQVFHTMDKIDRALYERFADIKVLATDSIISSRDSTPKQITERLIENRNQYKTYASLSFFDLNRIRIADSGGLYLDKQQHMVKYWQEVLQGEISAASDIWFDEELKMPIVHFASAVKDDDGEPFGAVITRMPITRLYEITKEAAGIHGQEKNLKIDLVDKDGLLLYSNYNRRGILRDNLFDYGIFKKPSPGEKIGSLIHYSPIDAVENLSAFAREQGYLDFKGNDWTLFLCIPTKIAFAPAVQLRNRMIAIFSVIIVLIIVISLIFSRTISRPITNLKNAAVEIGKGKLDTRIEIDSRDEIGELAASFNAMAEDLKGTTTSIDNLNREIAERKKAEEALEVSNRELRDFVYIASHDLREPLRKISSFGMLLEESLEGKLQGEDQENMEFMIDGANRMSQMIGSLLEYSRVGGKAIVYETVDLNEAVEQLEQLELAALLEETGGIIEVPQPLPSVQADPVQIRQLLQNLIVNAIKYHRDGIGPRILIRAVRKDSLGEQTAENAVRIEVQDNGIGIEEEHHRRIFKMFKRLHSRDKYEGAGIGLAICQKIVERHGGRIGVESKAGAGSTFWFTLPASKKLEQEQEKLISSLET